MGRSRRPPAKKADSDSVESDPHPRPVIFLTSSDDEEANKDLSLEIVQRAKEKELKRKRSEDRDLVINVDSASSLDDIETNFGHRVDGDEEKTKKKKKKSLKGKSKKQKEVKEADATVEVAISVLKDEEPVGTADSAVTEVNEVPDNAILRKLLRGPRYFDPGDRDSGACFNCGEEGHAVANCPMEKKQKPCFVCGMFGHNSKRCTQGQDCFICKRRGHIAKNCPDKYKHIPRDSVICLRCGDIGHDMLSCRNDFAPEDLKEIQCYVCKKYGHLCCVDYMDKGPKEVSCYNCAQSGHTGHGCAKSRGEYTESASSTLCYKCGEEGHFARGCTKNSKFDRWEGGYSSPRKHGNRDYLGTRSVSSDFGKAQKMKKKFQYEDKFENRWNETSSKSRTKGGWIVDDPGDLSRRQQKANHWRKSIQYSSASGGHYSASQSPFKKHKTFVGTPNSNTSKRSHQQGFSTPRNYGKSQGYSGRSWS